MASLFWDQDHFILERTPAGVRVNPTAREVISRLGDKGYSNYLLSNKSPADSIEKANAAGLEGLFGGYYDGRLVEGSKSIRRAAESLGIGLDEVARSSLYLGDNLDGEIVIDAPGMVQIFDPRGIDHDFSIFLHLVEFLEKRGSDFREAHQNAAQKQRIYDQDGITFLLQQLSLRRHFQARQNWRQYPDLTGVANIILVTDVDKKFKYQP